MLFVTWPAFKFFVTEWANECLWQCLFICFAEGSRIGWGSWSRVVFSVFQCIRTVRFMIFREFREKLWKIERESLSFINDSIRSTLLTGQTFWLIQFCWQLRGRKDDWLCWCMNWWLSRLKGCWLTFRRHRSWFKWIYLWGRM